MSKRFFPKLFCFFCTQSSKLSRNMHKLCVKLCNATIYPPWGPVKKHTPPSSEMLDVLRRWHLKGIDEKNQGYFLSGALHVTILRKVSCFFKKMGWQSLLHGKMNHNLENCRDLSATDSLHLPTELYFYWHIISSLNTKRD